MAAAETPALAPAAASTTTTTMAAAPTTTGTTRAKTVERRRSRYSPITQFFFLFFVLVVLNAVAVGTAAAREVERDQADGYGAYAAAAAAAAHPPSEDASGVDNEDEKTNSNCIEPWRFEDCKAEYIAMTEKYQAARDDYAICMENDDAVREALKNTREEVDELKRQINDNEGCQRDSAMCQDDLRREKAVIAQLNDSLQVCNSQVATLRTDVNECSNEVNKAKADSRGATQDLKNTAESLETEIEKVKDLNDQLTHYKNELAKIREADAITTPPLSAEKAVETLSHLKVLTTAVLSHAADSTLPSDWRKRLDVAKPTISRISRTVSDIRPNELCKKTPFTDRCILAHQMASHGLGKGIASIKGWGRRLNETVDRAVLQPFYKKQPEAAALVADGAVDKAVGVAFLITLISGFLTMVCFAFRFILCAVRCSFCVLTCKCLRSKKRPTSKKSASESRVSSDSKRSSGKPNSTSNKDFVTATAVDSATASGSAYSSARNAASPRNSRKGKGRKAPEEDIVGRSNNNSRYGV